MNNQDDVQPVIQQHFVPVFYLKNFMSRNGKVCVYDRSESVYFECSPKQICQERFLYETKWRNASDALGDYVLFNRIEKSFMDLEGEYATVVNMALSIKDDRKLVEYIKENRTVFMELATNLYSRNPFIMRSLMDYYNKNVKGDPKIEKNVQDIFNQYNLGSAESMLEYSYKESSFRTDIEGSPANIFMTRIKDMFVSVIKSSGYPFITSSFPVILSTIVGKPPRADGRIVFLPISSYCGLLYSNYMLDNRSNKEVGYCHNDFVSFINSAYLDLPIEQSRFVLANNMQVIKDAIKRAATPSMIRRISYDQL